MKKTHTLLNRHQLLDPVALRNWLAHNLDPVARADQLLTLRPEELNCIFDTLSMPEGASLLASLPAECAGHLLLRPHGSIVGILQGTLARRDLLAILRRLDEHDRKTLLARLPDPARKAFQSLLAWPNESVGANMRHEYLAVEANATVESAKQLIHGAWDQARLFGHLYVVDGEQRLLGSVSLKSLLIADPLLPVGELMEGEAVRINARADQELAARLLIDRDLSLLPVEDQGRLVGVFHVDDAADILELESTEDAELMYRIFSYNQLK